MSDGFTYDVLPDGRPVRFMARDAMEPAVRLMRAAPGGSWPAAKLPVDWAKSLSFPIDGNDRYGICGLAMAAHADNTWTGNNGAESDIDVAALEKQYFRYSGGDRGLTEDSVVAAWKEGLAGDADATIYDALDIDPTDAAAMQGAVDRFGVVCFALALPNRWISSFDGSGGTLWDAPCVPNPLKGHFVLINGVDEKERYKTQTWGSFAWMTPAGVARVRPSAFVPYSLRWFSKATGLAPNGMSYQDAAKLWASVGGSASLPPGPTPINPPAPTPTPTPADDGWHYSDGA